jgi:hypothetical protein
MLTLDVPDSLARFAVCGMTMFCGKATFFSKATVRRNAQ